MFYAIFLLLYVQVQRVIPDPLLLRHGYWALTILMCACRLFPTHPKTACALLMVYRHTLELVGDFVRFFTLTPPVDVRHFATQSLSKHFSVDTRTFTNLPKTPSILVVNYAHDRLENLMLLLLPLGIVLVRCPDVIGLGNRVPIFELPDKDGFRYLRHHLPRLLEQYRYVICFVNRPHRIELRKGIFELAAQQTHLITPVWCSHIKSTCGIIREQPLQINVGTPFRTKSTVHGQHVVRRHFRKSAKQWTGNSLTW